MSVFKITTENFEKEVLGSNKPVLVDFYATWCGPCKMLSPVVDQLAEELGDRVAVGKVNIDEEMALTEKFNIMSVPTLMVFKNGKAVGQSVGFVPKEQIKKMIEK